MWEAGTKVRVKPGAIDDGTVGGRLSYGTIYTIRGIYEIYPGRGQFNGYVTLVTDDTGEINPVNPWDPERRFEVVEPAAEPVYVYVAYAVSRNTNVKQAISHPDEERFNSMIDSWSRQGYDIKAKKRIKFNL